MIEFEHVYKSYSDTKAVLTDVSLKIETGELFTLIGSSGCGKTTLLKTINKLNTFDQDRWKAGAGAGTGALKAGWPDR